MDVSYNEIVELNETNRLGELPFLEELYVEGNPFTDSKQHRIHLFAYLNDKDKNVFLFTLIYFSFFHLFFEFQKKKKVKIDGEVMSAKELVTSFFFSQFFFFLLFENLFIKKKKKSFQL